MRSLPCQIGEAGELFVSYYLTYHYNIECALVDRPDDDIWLKTPNRRIRSLQVKTTSQPHITRKGPVYRFKIHKNTADLYAFVALDRQTFLLWNAKKINTTMMTLPAYKFTKVQMHRSIRLGLKL